LIVARRRAGRSRRSFRVARDVGRTIKTIGGRALGVDGVRRVDSQTGAVVKSASGDDRFKRDSVFVRDKQSALKNRERASLRNQAGDPRKSLNKRAAFNMEFHGVPRD
jgi:hypothetical protein